MKESTKPEAKAPAKPKQNPDAELQAMRRICRIFEELPPRSARNILRYLSDRFVPGPEYLGFGNGTMPSAHQGGDLVTGE
jgi:hypothetical protein